MRPTPNPSRPNPPHTTKAGPQGPPPPPALPLGPRRQAPTQNHTDPKPLPQHQGEPAGAPLPRPAYRQLREPQPHDRGVLEQPLAAIPREHRPRSALQHLDRLAPGELLRGVDLAQIEHVTLHHAPARQTAVLDHAPVAVFLTVLL